MIALHQLIDISELSTQTYARKEVEVRQGEIVILFFSVYQEN